MYKWIAFFILGFFSLLPSFAQEIDDSEKKHNVKGMLMLDEHIQLEATDAVNHMYNFKFDIAEKKFHELKDRYPDHPLPYYLLGLSNWWKMMPYPEEDKRLDLYSPDFIKYMETAVEKAEIIYDKDENNIEASFFICASHGLLARFYAESGKEMKTLGHSRKVFSYFKKLNDNNDLSPEFLFGSALFNYYAAWFKEEYPVLTPVLAFFPKGDKKLGVKQLKEVSYNAFWTRIEAQYFLMRIYFNEEDDDKNALPISKYLTHTFPDNPYFQRMYARLSYSMGQRKECEEVSESILYKTNIGMPGYEETSGRYASFFLGRTNYYAGNLDKAKEYYQKTIVFAEKTNSTSQNYYLHAVADLAKIADKEQDYVSAKQYYKTVLNNADKSNNIRGEAKLYLKKREEEEKKKK
jgi:hypothetical protein